MSGYQRHTFHLVDPSPWPFISSIAALTLTNGAVLYFHSYQYGGLILSFGLIMVLYCMIVWWRDVIRESTFEGHHTKIVQKGLRYGMILFIISEIMFFFCFFLSFFSFKFSSFYRNRFYLTTWSYRTLLIFTKYPY